MAISPLQYPSYFVEWYGYSLDNLALGNEDAKIESFATRASLVQLFLLARARQAAGTEPLGGASYALIPVLLVPRALMPDKPWSHEGTSLLNIRYGLQSRRDTYTTTIGWGLFNEAFGNFGYVGIAGLAVVLGTVLGAYARWTHRIPELSARFLGGVLVLAMAFQTEFSSGVLIADTVPVPHGTRCTARRARRSAAGGRMTHRLAVITTHPIQYYAPWFRYLSGMPGLDLRAFYLWDFGVTDRVDPQFGQAIRWDVPLLEGYDIRVRA